MSFDDDKPYGVFGPQPQQPGEEPSNFTNYGFGVGTIAASGFLPTQRGRLFDNYLRGIRAVETAFPAAILRTFRVSEALSPLEHYSKIDVSADQITRGGKYADYLKTVFGSSVDSLSLNRNNLAFGVIKNKGGQAIGQGLQILASTQKGVGIADYYARLYGTNLNLHGVAGSTVTDSLNDALLRAEFQKAKLDIPYKQWLESLDPVQRQKRLIIGAPYRSTINVLGNQLKLTPSMQVKFAKVETATNLARAMSATVAGRLNTLLRAPLELPVIGPVVSKIPFLKSLAVKPGTTTQMVRGYVGRGLAIGAAFKGLEYIDYLRAEGNEVQAAFSSTVGGAALGAFVGKKLGQRFSPRGLLIGAALGLSAGVAPRFDEGIFAGVATTYADVQIGRAAVSESIGLSESLRRHQEIAPDMASLSTAVGFAGVGALTVGLGNYAHFIGGVASKIGKTDEPLWSLIQKTREIKQESIGEKIWESKIGKKVSKTKVGSFLSKVRSPMAIGALGGTALWAGVNAAVGILGGNPLAAIPGAGILGTTETPEELEAIYSGEKEIAVRKGRWWEFGRCIGPRCIIPVNETGMKYAEDINLSDRILASDGKYYSVLNIWKRKFEGNLINFYSSLDKNIATCVTGNHKIPILTEFENKFNVEEKEAEDIKIDDYVQIPIPKLKEDIKYILSDELIKTGLFIDKEDKLYPAQLNWHNKNKQISRGASIPKKIELSKGLGRLFGYFLAEGNLSYKNDSPTIIETVHAKSEEWIVDDIIYICEKEFNITPTVRFKKTGKKSKDGCWIVRICSSLLARVFFELFYKSNRKQDKLFPDIFMSAPKGFKKELIEGYWRGDGHYDKKAKVVSSCRKDFLDKIQIILLNFNLPCSILKFEENNFRGRYRLRWNENGTYLTFKKYNGCLYAKIQRIDIKEYSGNVYDFEIDHPDHLFVAGTFLVHNSSSYSGGKIDYFRPHAIARLRSRAYQKGLYGNEEERWEHDPLLNPIKSLFGSDEWKYHYDIKYQYERPGVLTSTYGEDVPFIGPLIAATVGKFLKPRKLVRPDEWALGGGRFAEEQDLKEEEIPSYELGGIGPGAPVSPDNLTQLFNELNYRRREAVGLVGFAEGALQKAITGREEVFQNLETMSTMGKETGSEYWLWKHLNLGGAAGTSEAIRRFIPRTPSHLETYNPLKNELPSWLPDDYFINLKYGNPFEKIAEAEIRLPGAGYESLNPEVAGLDPERYPLIHRLKILSDVAMWSDEYKYTLAVARRANLSEKEQERLQTIIEQVKQKKDSRKEFREYRFQDDVLNAQQVTVSNIIRPGLIQTKEFGDLQIALQGVGAIKDKDAAMAFAENQLLGQKIELQTSAIQARSFTGTGNLKAVAMLEGTDYGSLLTEKGLAERKELSDEFEQLRFSPLERLAGRIAERAMHGADTPLEMLTPLSPASKFIRHRSAIEEYAATEAIGTGNAFWDRPIENFLRPALNMMQYKTGIATIPENVQERRDIQEYFDMLKWVKNERLKNQALLQRDFQAAQQAQEEKESTVFGADLFGRPPLKALPRKDRGYFESFVNVQTEEERQQILNLVPENQQRVYISQWLRQEEAASRAKKEAGIVTEYDNRVLSTTKALRKSEGFAYTKDLEEQWLQETNGDIPYDEWIRQKKAEEYFLTHSLPGADWIGFHPSVDLEDVKMKAVQMEGLDYHDFDLWGDRERALAQKPYINEEVVQQMMAGGGDYDRVTRSFKKAENLAKLSNNYNIQTYNMTGISDNKFNIEVRDGRENMIERAYKELGA